MEPKDIIKMTTEFLAPVGESLSDGWKAIVGDKVSHWRLRNAMKLQVQTQAEATRLGLQINPSRVPERYAYAWFEEASKADEPEIQILFARLLLRAAEGNSDAEDRRLIRILGEMTPVDAMIFQRIYSDFPFPDSGTYSEARSLGSDQGLLGTAWPRDWMTALVKQYHAELAEKAIEHLITIGCIGLSFAAEGKPGSPSSPQDYGTERTNWRRFITENARIRPYVTSTALGLSLAKAVRA